MGLFDMKKLRNVVQGAAVTAASAVRDAADAAATAAEEGKLPDVKLPDIKMPDIKLPDQVTNLVGGAKTDDGSASIGAQGVSAQDALSVLYYLMSADGELTSAELTRFSEICTEFGETYVRQSESIVTSCNAELDAHASSIPLVSVMTCVDGLLYTAASSRMDTSTSGDATEETPAILVTPKQLLWNMLAVSYSDESFDEVEREVVNHVAQHFNVDAVLLQELEHAILTLTDLEREERWVKTTNRSYLEIETQVEEIGRRKSAVLEGVQSLVAL